MRTMIRRGSWDDFDAVYAVIASPQFTTEQLRSRWSVPSFDPARHLWIAAENGRVAAFGALYAPDTAFVRGDTGQIAPLLDRIEAQARTEGVSLLTFVIPEWDEPAWRAYLAYGFENPTNVLEMEAETSPAPERVSFPEGVSVRTYDESDARTVQSLLDRAYTSWDDAYVAMEHDDWRAWMTGDESFDPTCWWLAEAEGSLAGVCLTWKEGWVKDIAVDDNWRGRGLGKALLLHALAEHRRRRNTRVGLKVDDRNPTAAIPLYERAGFQTIKRYRVLVKRL
jgi:ribosomal protein S18 acetylase RimI-like enzyme